MEEKEKSFGACLMALEECRREERGDTHIREKRERMWERARAGKTYYLSLKLIRAPTPFLPCSNAESGASDFIHEYQTISDFLAS